MTEVNYDKLKEIFKMLVESNKISHAYIFEGTNSLINKESVFLFSKTIEDNLNINNEIKIIETDDKMIKKEDIISMRVDGEKTTMQNGFKIFAIIDAEKMNLHSANSLLKFLEEPVSNVIIILTVQNKYQIIETILSRCQQINIDMYIDSCLEDNYNEEILKTVANFVLNIETKKEKALADISDYWANDLEHKIILEEFIDLIIFLYRDVLNYNVGLDIKKYKHFTTTIDKINNINTFSLLTNKISFLVNYRDKLKYNINRNLFLDKIIISLGRGEVSND